MKDYSEKQHHSNLIKPFCLSVVCVPKGKELIKILTRSVSGISSRDSVPTATKLFSFIIFVLGISRIQFTVPTK
ncbi:hypothetical protein AYI68_g6485 [Smittium mucronatum]|uniref:Uncharacterized protein n=1 Tax=Smittium mucronatum TaxID=133383 RepID=A0A1R0GRD9_9FUNG|nr:hypothetical protein AYI68_g6485 [Smittium mucronatum]